MRRGRGHGSCRTGCRARRRPARAAVAQGDEGQPRSAGRRPPARRRRARPRPPWRWRGSRARDGARSMPEPADHAAAQRGGASARSPRPRPSPSRSPTRLIGPRRPAAGRPPAPRAAAARALSADPPLPFSAIAAGTRDRAGRPRPAAGRAPAVPVRYSISRQDLRARAPWSGAGDDEPQVQPVLALVVVVDLREAADERRHLLQQLGRHLPSPRACWQPAVCGATTAPTRETTPSATQPRAGDRARWPRSMPEPLGDRGEGARDEREVALELVEQA